jgi:hypothetical protein
LGLFCLAAGQSLLFASLLKGSLLQHLLALLLSLLLELGELLLTSLIANALLLLLTGCSLFGLAKFTLLFFTLTLLTKTSIPDLLLALGNLLLKLSLGITTALLKLITTTLVQGVTELLVLRHQAAKSVLELHTLLMLDLSILKFLSLNSVVDLAVFFDLLGVVLGQLLGFLLAEGTFKMIETLACYAKALVNVVLLTFKLSQLHSTQSVAIKVVKILQIDVDSLVTNVEFCDLLLEFLLTDAVTLSLEALGFAFLLLIRKSHILSLLKSLLTKSLLASILLFLLGLDF